MSVKKLMDDEFFIRHCFESIVAFDHSKSHEEKKHHCQRMFSCKQNRTFK